MKRIFVSMEGIRDAWRIRRYRRRQHKLWGKLSFSQRVLALSFLRD